MILAKCKFYIIWLTKHAVICPHAICWEWVTAAKYVVVLTLYTTMTNRRRQGMGSSTTIWRTFPHGLIEHISLGSLVFPACWLMGPPSQMLLLEYSKTAGEATALHDRVDRQAELVLCRITAANFAQKFKRGGKECVAEHDGAHRGWRGLQVITPVCFVMLVRVVGATVLLFLRTTASH